MSKNNMRSYRICAGLLCLLLLIVALPQKAFAAGPIEPDRNVSLTIDYRHQDKPASGVAFQLYRIAEVSPAVEFTLTADFKTYPVSLDNLDSAGWRALANTLEGYVARDGVAALDSGITDQDGRIRFPQQQTTLAAGLYLVIGQQSVEGQYTYTPEPFLICLPNRNAADQWDYDVIAVPKYDSTYHPGDTISRKVLKVWKDDGNQEQRPKEVIVQLLRDGKVFDTVTLTSANNWRYTWEELDGNYLWQLVEKAVPDGYTVSVGREGVTFVVTNSYRTGKPEGPKPPGKPLPQTGMLWWPVSVLAGAGMLILLIGWVIHRNRSESDQ